MEQVRAALRDYDANLGIVSTEEQREEAINLATEQEEWLYDDGWDMDAATYRKKRAELAEVGEMALAVHVSICWEIASFLFSNLFRNLRAGHVGQKVAGEFILWFLSARFRCSAPAVVVFSFTNVQMAEAMFFRSSELLARPAELERAREFTTKV